MFLHRRGNSSADCVEAVYALWWFAKLHCALQSEGQYGLPATAFSSSAQLEYQLQSEASIPSCEVKYISLGAAFACIAANTGTSTTTFNVSLKQHVDQTQLSPGKHTSTTSFC